MLCPGMDNLNRLILKLKETADEHGASVNIYIKNDYIDYVLVDENEDELFIGNGTIYPLGNRSAPRFAVFDKIIKEQNLVENSPNVCASCKTGAVFVLQTHELEVFCLHSALLEEEVMSHVDI